MTASKPPTGCWTLEKATYRPAKNPGIGHVREELADRRHRFFPIYSYLIVYRSETRPLQVIRVLHGARDVQSILGLTLEEPAARGRGPIPLRGILCRQHTKPQYPVCLRPYAPSVKQQLAAIRMIFDWLVVGQVIPGNAAHTVRGRGIRQSAGLRRY